MPRSPTLLGLVFLVRIRQISLALALISATMRCTVGGEHPKILYACMQRPPGERAYRLILDEARFFNTGPLEVILETSRAYNLWLTLVVQNLDQMARMREGRVDLRLKETAINLCRYFCIFHNISDAALFARIMFPLTGQVPTGIRMSGDYEYLPVPAEENEHEQRFMNVEHREMVFYDKLGSEPPRVWRTPEVIMDEPEQSRLDQFERAHLRATGRLVSEIRGEIARRQEKWRALFEGGTPRIPSTTAPSSSRYKRASAGPMSAPECRGVSLGSPWQYGTT